MKTEINGAHTSAALQPAAQPTELDAETLRFRVDCPTQFQTTAELTPGRAFIGQERARAALEMGVGIASKGFHIFVSGLTGADKLDALKNWIAQQAPQAATPGDWVYVHNFAHPDHPLAIALAAGQGCQLKALMTDLTKTLREELPKAFREEAFDKEKTELKDKYLTKAQEMGEALRTRAREKNFLLQMGPGGNFILIPILNGKPIENPAELEQLNEVEKRTIEHNQRELAKEISAFSGKQQEMMRAMSEDVRAVEKRFCDSLLTPLLTKIKDAFHNDTVNAYLDQVKAHTLDNLDHFKEAEGPATAGPMGLPISLSGQERDPFLEYEVNVIVDNSQTSGAPVIVESAPTYLNLFGTIERVVDRAGRLVTNFTRIKAGSLFRAHGGYLIFNLEDALTEAAVWKVLKRTLKSGRIEMETYEPFALFSTSGLKPEPVDIQVKVIVVGSPYLYNLLYSLDDEFREIFKVHADFRHSMELNDDHYITYGQWVAQLCQQENLPHFDRAAVERLVEFGARRAGDRHKISASYAEIADLVREAAYWAGTSGETLVSVPSIEKALHERDFRSNRIEEEIREMITQGTILVDSTGSRVGQVNGLSVLQLGEYAFGRPSRVTASVAMGRAGIVNIERESRLSGSIHDKGLLILSGYLRNRYGQDKPLALSASLCFEQSYSGVEGDSASSTELYALLSCLADLPLRQDIAVTGSVNQWGEVQAIGGANEKIEGFFDVCRVAGLTGTQGVMIPASNVRNLILRSDVIEAVAQGKFHIYPIQTIDEGIALLSGVAAGSVDQPGTVNALVSQRLFDLAIGLREFASAENGKQGKTDAQEGDAPREGDTHGTLVC